MTSMTETMHILQPYPGLYAYYDGRIAGKRLHSEAPNWLDDGGYSLGIASYALVEADEAIVYDTHMSIDHATAIRRHIEALGVRSIRVVLSHWHTDHVAGNAVFADCEMIALGLTDKALREHRSELENNDPPISPLVLPNRLFDGRLDLTLAHRRIELHHFDIHSADGCVIWLPDERLLLAGDTVEDTVTYISEPEHIATHVSELARMATWPIHRILPNHGSPTRIAAGGYDASLIGANRGYLQRLLDREALRDAGHASLEAFVSGDIASGAIEYFAPYQAVHRENIAAMNRVQASR